MLSRNIRNIEVDTHSLVVGMYILEIEFSNGNILRKSVIIE